jgi:hypothetical protein
MDMLRVMAVFVCALTVLGQTAKAEEPTADDYLKCVSFLEGEWESTGSDGQTSSLTIKTLPTKNCTLGNAVMNGEPAFQVISYYDPEQKGWKRILIGARGWVGTILVKADKATLTGPRKGVTLKGEVKFTSPDGTVRESVATLTVVSDDEWKSGFGEDMVVTFNRKK